LAKEKGFYELSKTQTLTNSQLAEWLRDIEDQVKGTAAKQSKEKSA
jgi:hypothetical protein